MRHGGGRDCGHRSRRTAVTNSAFFFAGFAFLNLLPASNLLFPSGTIMAERLLYLPSVGLVAILAIVIDNASKQLPRPSLVTAVVFVSIATGYGVRTWIRNLDWRDDLTMATVSVETSPASFKVHRSLATDLLQIDPSHSNIDRVIAEADRSIAILAGVPDASNTSSTWNIAADGHLAKRDLELCSGGKADSRPCSPDSTSARREFERAAQIALRSTQIEAAGRTAYNRRHGTRIPAAAAAADGYRILASAYLRLEEAEQALTAALQAKTIDPSNPEAYAQIAAAELAEKRGEDAAISLVEGMFVTSDAALRNDLLTIYRSGVDTKGCAQAPGPAGPALNPLCDIVQRDFCAAAAEVQRQDVIEQFACGQMRKHGN